jgi:GNAT superfamily N-acetyltransferase
VVDGYSLQEGTPPVQAYRRLRQESGLTPRSEEQSLPALAGGWWGCHVVHDASGDVVAMGRLIGDGGWYFHVVDMATLPAHQRRGLGDLVLGALLDRIREHAPPGAFVSLMADPPGRRLYARHGFTEDPEASIGMARWLG